MCMAVGICHLLSTPSFMISAVSGTGVCSQGLANGCVLLVSVHSRPRAQL